MNKVKQINNLEPQDVPIRSIKKLVLAVKKELKPNYKAYIRKA